MAASKKERKNRFERTLMKLGLGIINTLSERQVRNFLLFIANTFGYKIGIRKKLVKFQLKRCFPNFTDKEVNDITKRMYQNYGLMIYEIFKADRDKIADEIEIVGLDNFDKALQMEQSFLISTGHFGNWELLGYFLLKRGFKLSAIAKKQRNPYFDKFFVDYRADLGLDVIYQKRAMRGIVKAIKGNRKIFFIMDQDARSNGEVMPFLGFDASVFMGIARIALKADLPIIPMYHVRTKEGKHKIIVEEMFFPKQEGLTDYQVMDRLNKSLENMIKEYPELWFWVHKRWKSVDKKKGIRY